MPVLQGCKNTECTWTKTQFMIPKPTLFVLHKIYCHLLLTIKLIFWKWAMIWKCCIEALFFSSKFLMIIWKLSNHSMCTYNRIIKILHYNQAYIITKNKKTKWKFMLKERKKKERLQYTFFNLISKHATKSHLKNNFKAVAFHCCVLYVS